MANMIEQSLLCKVLDAPDLEILHSNGVVEEMFLKEVLEKLEADKERDRQSTDPYSTQNITEDSNNLFPNLNAQNSQQEALNAQGATIPQPEQ